MLLQGPLATLLNGSETGMPSCALRSCLYLYHSGYRGMSCGARDGPKFHLEAGHEGSSLGEMKGR